MDTPASIFLTGGNGFVGTSVVQAMLQRGYRVTALDRSGSLRRSQTASDNLHVVSGDLLDPRTYRDALSAGDVVVHLAASTGRASRAEHFRINAAGTETLLQECRRSGVARFVFISSIAASFPDIASYPYAQAKVRAEQAVRESGLSFVILRPTMILGPGSPILAALEKLAGGRVVPVFGSGQTRVQPLYVEDAARFICQAVEDDRFSNQTFDIGGPDILSIEDLIQRIRLGRKGSRGSVVHIPMALVLPPLKLAEAAGVGRFLPLSTGQLSTFRFDGVVAANSLHDSLRAGLVDVSRMVALSGERGLAESDLGRECRIFTMYLLGCPPDAYVMRKYAEAHALGMAAPLTDRLDGYLVGFAGRRPICTGIADAYARLFLPAATLRKKLVLLLAILETCPPFSRRIDSAPGPVGAVLLLRLALRGGTAVLSALAGIAVFVPVRIALAMATRRE